MLKEFVPISFIKPDVRKTLNTFTMQFSLEITFLLMTSKAQIASVKHQTCFRQIAQLVQPPSQAIVPFATFFESLFYKMNKKALS